MSDVFFSFFFFGGGGWGVRGFMGVRGGEREGGLERIYGGEGERGEEGGRGRNGEWEWGVEKEGNSSLRHTHIRHTIYTNTRDSLGSRIYYMNWFVKG